MRLVSFRGSVLVGRSVHNQPIERLWRDVREKVVDHFKYIFTVLEHHMHVFRPQSPLDRHCLLAVFMPVLQDAMEEFRSAWNNHHIRNRAHGTPSQQYEPCKRWEMVDDATWEVLKSCNYSHIVEGDDQVEALCTLQQDTPRAGDPVRLGNVANFDVGNSAQLRDGTASLLGELDCHCPDDHMFEFYVTYRHMVQEATSPEDWPVLGYK